MMKNIKSESKKINDVWDKTLYVDTLSEFKPERLDALDYQFTLSVENDNKDQTVRLFNFDIPHRGPWSVEMVVKEDGEPFWHDVVHPQKQSEWQKLFNNDTEINSPEAEKFMHALIHSYNKAQKAVKDLCYEDMSGEESLDLDSHPLPEQIEIVPKFAMQGGYTILFGEAGAGKSLLAHNIGLRAASGTRSLNPDDERAPMVVHYLSLEMGSVQFRERHNKLLESYPEIARKNFFFITPDSLDFTNPRERSKLYNTLKKRGTKLLIIDCHSFWLGGIDESNNSDINNYIVTPLKDIADKLGLAIILIHHSGWSDKDRIRGASSLWNGAEIGIFMEPDPTDINRTAISFKKWRPTSKRRPRAICYAYDPEKYTMRVAGEDSYVNQLKPGSPADVKKQIMDLAHVQMRQARNKLKTLLAQGYLYQDGNGVIRIPDHAKRDDPEPQPATKRASGKKHARPKRK